MLREKNLCQYNGASIRECEPINGVLGILSSNQINIATFDHQMGDTHIAHPLDKRRNIYLI